MYLSLGGSLILYGAVRFIAQAGKLPTSHRRGPRPVSDPSAWYLWWTTWYCNKNFSENFRFFPVRFIPSVFHTHSFIYHWRCIFLAPDSVDKNTPISRYIYRIDIMEAREIYKLNKALRCWDSYFKLATSPFWNLATLRGIFTFNNSNIRILSFGKWRMRLLFQQFILKK